MFSAPRGPLAAAHGQDDGLRPCSWYSAVVRVRSRCTRLVRRERQAPSCPAGWRCPASSTLRDKPRGVLGAGQLLAEGVQAEAVVDALVQNAAQFAVALQDRGYPPRRFLARVDGGGQPGGAAADDDKINRLFMRLRLPSQSSCSPTMSFDAPPDFVISLLRAAPSSRARISMHARASRSPPDSGPCRRGCGA